MKTHKVKQGLYELHNDCQGYFSIEKNTGDFENCQLNHWIVTHHIGFDVEQFEDCFLTKKDAIGAIGYVLDNGVYCYD